MGEQISTYTVECEIRGGGAIVHQGLIVYVGRLKGSPASGKVPAPSFILQSRKFKCLHGNEPNEVEGRREEREGARHWRWYDIGQLDSTNHEYFWTACQQAMPL